MHNDLKKILRKNYKKIQLSLLPDVQETILKQVSKEIKKIISDFHPNGYLGLYWPLENEIDLRPLKDNLEIPIALPASRKDGNLTYHPWTEIPLRKDLCGIPAPLDEPKLSADKLSLLIVPALAIDQKGFRLGYGRGFYDRLRASADWREITSIVVLPKACVREKSLPIDPWDIPFNGWINEEGIFRCIPELVN